MATVRRRDLRGRPMSRSAWRLLRLLAERHEALGFPREEVERSGMRADWAWSGLLALEARGFVRKNDFGHLELTRAGAAAAKRPAA